MSPANGDAAGDGGGPIPVLEGERADDWVRRSRDAADDDAGAAATAARQILSEVRAGGDEAVLRLTEEHDGRRPRALRVPAERCERALADLPGAVRAALERARRNVRCFHAAQRRDEPPVEVEPGVRAWRAFRAIDRVGVYVPGGRAAYPSSLVMTAVPARVAGCRRVVACSPPRGDGEPHPAVMATAALLEVDALFAVGGAQAVGAMAYGTETVPRVDKIFGPGSRWVNAAKLAVFEDVAVDLPAGPSEVTVWADGDADPDLVAAELLAQAEHGPDSVAVGIVPDRTSAERVAARLERRLAEAPRRTIAAESLAGSALLVTDDGERALGWVNALAPEHLVLLRHDAAGVLERVRHAGSVFLGPNTPVAAGDYASGTNHVLPTRARSRAAGGLSLDDFGKWMQVQEMDATGLERLGPAVVELAEWEGLPAHAASVRARLVAGTAGHRGDDPGVDALVRPHLADVEPYATARSRHTGGVLLDANENAFGSPVDEDGPDLHRYPDPSTPGLKAALAGWLDVPRERLWVGNGSDEAIDLLIRTLVAPGEAVVVTAPSYGVYEARGRTHDAEVRHARLDDDFDLDLEATAARARDAKLVLICSPNNPTGNRLSAGRVLALVERCPALVAVDEAYVEFARGDSLAGRAGEIERLAVLRTFSKAWGLAAARVGYLVGAPALVDSLGRAGLPYPLSAPSARLAERALRRADEMERRVDRLRDERERLRRGIESIGLAVLPSEANFLLFFVEHPGGVQRRLAAEHGVVVRDRSGLAGLEGALRVTVGTPDENDRFLDALRSVLAGEGTGPGAPAATGDASGADRTPRGST